MEADGRSNGREIVFPSAEAVRAWGEGAGGRCHWVRRFNIVFDEQGDAVKRTPQKIRTDFRCRPFVERAAAHILGGHWGLQHKNAAVPTI